MTKDTTFRTLHDISWPHHGPPRKAEKVARFPREPRRLERTPHPVIEPVEVLAPEARQRDAA